MATALAVQWETLSRITKVYFRLLLGDQADMETDSNSSNSNKLYTIIALDQRCL